MFDMDNFAREVIDLVDDSGRLEVLLRGETN